MQASQIPNKFAIPFASGAGASYITQPIPTPSQIPTNPGRASLTDGFPPLTFLLPSAGGVPPDGRDVQGVLYMASSWDQWEQARGPCYYDSGFSTSIGGYPHGTLLNAIGIDAGYWFCLADNNTVNPDTGTPQNPAANWLFCSVNPYYLTIQANTTYFVDRTIGSDTLYDGTSATISGSHGPWATVAHAFMVLQTYTLNGNTVTIQLGATGTYAAPSGPLVAPSNGTLVIRGDPVTPANYTISGVPSSAFVGVLSFTSGTVVTNGFVLENTGGLGYNLFVESVANVTLTNTVFGTSTSGVSALIYNQSVVSLGPGNSLAGFASTCLVVDNGKMIQANNVATSGTPAFTTFINCTNNGVFQLGPGSPGWTGSGATGVRYNANLGGIINTNGGGANFFPGNSAGSATSPGAYA